MEAELAEIQSGTAWRVAVALREVARRHPRLARRVLQIARVLWWILHGRLISQLRIRQRVRAQLRAEAVAAGATSSPPVQAPSPPDPQAHPTDVQTSSPPVQSPSPPDAPSTAPASSSNLRTIPAELLPSRRTPTLGRLSFLEERGHRPPLLAGPEQPEDWPLVSVVVTSFNYGQFVTEAIESVLAQTFKDLEVIVVEGGSSNPDSRFVVAELQRPRCRVLMQGGPHRAGANRNFGISQARGRYICCLDADDMLAPTYIEKAVFLLERHGYDVVSSAMKLMGSEQGQINIAEQPDLDALLDGNHVLTCAVFRRSFWEQAGGYRDVDPAVSGHLHEDWAFWIRLAALGARFRNLHHDAMLRYRVHTANLSRERHVLSMARQRQMVLQMNQDVLRSIPAKIAVSRRQATIRYGTPSAPPAALNLVRPQPDMKQRTLLLAMPFLILGGAERLLSDIVAHLVKVGWRVVVITTIDPGTDQGDTSPWFECHTPEIFHLPRGFPPELWEDFIHHLVRSRGVNVIWIVGSAFAYDCLRGLRAVHQGLRVADLLFNTVGHTANNRRRRDLIDLIFVENNEVHDWLVARGENGSRLRLVKSGVDLAALRPMTRSRALERQIGAASGDLIVGFSGRWSEEKNPVGFVEIARLVDPALPVRFVVTGTGNLRSAVERAVREACFPEGRFHLLGEISEFTPVLASFDLLVVPSVLDGRPVVVLEALSMGVPVVASRVGALPELVEDSGAGWLCEPGDLQAFAECIERAAGDRVGLFDMRRRAREYAESALDIQAMLKSYEAALASLLPESLRNA